MYDSDNEGAVIKSDRSEVAVCVGVRVGSTVPVECAYVTDISTPSVAIGGTTVSV